MSSSWRGKDREPSPHPTALLFHVSDRHDISGTVPDFAGGETWETLHQDLHVKRVFGNRDPHDHA